MRLLDLIPEEVTVPNSLLHNQNQLTRTDLTTTAGRHPPYAVSMHPIVAEILAGHLEREPPRYLYHYTRPAAVVAICETSTMLAGNAGDMNDVKEQGLATERCLSFLRESEDDLSDFIEKWEDNFSSRNMTSSFETLFTISFTEEEDALEQWRAYGAANGAMALGFQPDHLRAAASAQGFWLAPCIYDTQVQHEACQRLVEWITPQALASSSPEELSGVTRDFQSALVDLGALLKDPGFRLENEWRLISPWRQMWEPDQMLLMAGNSGIRQFVRFDLMSGVEPKDLDMMFYLGPYGDTRSMLQASDLLSRRLGLGSTSWGYSGLSHRLN